jgi:transposase
MTLADLAKREGVSRLTVWHWVHRGISKRGANVRLEARMVGGRWRVTEEQLERFHDDINDLARGQPPRPPNAHRREVERAVRELERKGIMKPPQVTAPPGP